MQKYKCHKIISAVQIEEISKNTTELYCGKWGVFDNPKKNQAGGDDYSPVVGDYLVEYEDGYRSISPKKAFEDGYRLIEGPYSGAESSDENPVVLAMNRLKLAMAVDPDYAHSWHCNIAMMCYDAIRADEMVVSEDSKHADSLRIGNDAASRFMKLCFGVETSKDIAKLSASEAVYGFVAWLTTRSETISMGATEECSKVAVLVGQFCKENNLDDPGENWANNLIHPSGECSGAST